MSKNNIRKIKCTSDCVNRNEGMIHPVSLLDIQNGENDKRCSHNNILLNGFITPCEKNELSLDELIKHMEVPSIYIDPIDIVLFYNIKTIDDLELWIDGNYKNKPFDTVNRIFNMWIYANIDNLKLFNNVLVSIIKKLLILNFNDIKEKHIDNELKNFVDYWLKKINKEQFEYNLIGDFKNYLNKKYDK